jgi:DNA-binding response OmpR family regulator
MTHRVLIVEDEAGLARVLRDRLRAQEYSVDTASSVEDAQRLLAREGFHVIVLDVMLPGRSGLDLLRELRERLDRTPVLLLTALGDVTQRIVGLKMGADDYLPKPFDMGELLARIEVLLRRARPQLATGVVELPDFTMDFQKGLVHKGNRAVDLSYLEFRLLRFLYSHRGAAVSRDQILREVWQMPSAGFTRTVDVHIARLRRKLEPDTARPVYIRTVAGTGYSFMMDR